MAHSGLSRPHQELTNATTTIEPSTVPCAKRRAYLTRRLRERDLGRDLEGAQRIS